MIVRRAAANSDHFDVVTLGRSHGLSRSRLLHAESDLALFDATCEFDAQGLHDIAAAIKNRGISLIVSAI